MYLHCFCARLSQHICTTKYLQCTPYSLSHEMTPTGAVHHQDQGSLLLLLVSATWNHQALPLNSWRLSKCPRKDVMVKMFEVEDMEEVSIGKMAFFKLTSDTNAKFQIPIVHRHFMTCIACDAS